MLKFQNFYILIS